MGKPSRGRQARRKQRKAKQQRKKSAKQSTAETTTTDATIRKPPGPSRPTVRFAESPRVASRKPPVLPKPTVRWVEPPAVANHELRGELEVFFPTPFDPVGRIELDLLVRFEEDSFPPRWWNAAVYDEDGIAVLSGGWEPDDPIEDQIPWEEGTDDPYLDLLEAFFQQPTERTRMRKLLPLLQPPTRE